MNEEDWTMKVTTHTTLCTHKGIKCRAVYRPKSYVRKLIFRTGRRELSSFKI